MLETVDSCVGFVNQVGLQSDYEDEEEAAALRRAQECLLQTDDDTEFPDIDLLQLCGEGTAGALNTSTTTTLPVAALPAGSGATNDAVTIPTMNNETSNEATTPKPAIDGSIVTADAASSGCILQ